jgi:hypothetical protein
LRAAHPALDRVRWSGDIPGPMGQAIHTVEDLAALDLLQTPV